MRWIILMLLILLSSTFCFAQNVPADIDTSTLQKIDQEHKNTRKFFSDEMTRQRQEYFKMIDDRATYYENTADKLLTTAVFKLGLLWAGIVVFVVGITQLLRLRLEKNRFDKMLKTIRLEIANSQKAAAAPHATQPAPNIADTQDIPVQRQDLSMVGDRLMTPPKKGYFERRREKKVRKKMVGIEKQRAKLRKEEQKLVGGGLPIPNPPQQLQPQTGSVPQRPEQKKSDVSYDFEVTY